jgi:hypothetical protein
MFDLDRDCMFNRLSNFVLDWPKEKFISFCVVCILLDKITYM